MGNWHATIVGGGQHDNSSHDDVEQIIARTVKALRVAGHHVTAAVVTSGCACDVAGAPDAGHVPAPLTRIPRDPSTGARRAYERYIASSGGLNYQGKPCPTWDELPDAIRGHWLAAVS